MNNDYKSYTAAADLLHDRIILITGASDGIGRALALSAAALGGQIILHGRNVQKLEKVYDEIEALGTAPRPSIAVLDLASANSNAYESLATNLAEEYGRLDGLVHNASIIGDRFSIEQYDAVQWQRVMHVNLTSAFALTQVLLPMVKQAKDPSIIFTSSSVGRIGRARCFCSANRGCRRGRSIPLRSRGRRKAGLLETKRGQVSQ